MKMKIINFYINFIYGLFFLVILLIDILKYYVYIYFILYNTST